VRDAEFRGLKMISESHPLQEFFQDLVGRHYAHEIGIAILRSSPTFLIYWRNSVDAEHLYKVMMGAIAR